MNWRALWVPAVAVLAAFVALIALGLWQLDRKVWKEDLIASLRERLSAFPVPIPPSSRWPALDPTAEEFRRVVMRARFAGSSEARLFSGGSGLRDDVKSAGYFAFAPAILADGSTVVVNRGFVDNPNPDAALKPIAVNESMVERFGVLRWPERPNWFVPSYSERQDLWFLRDQRLMAAHYGWGEVAPFYVEMEGPAPTGGVPRPGPLTAKLSNNHLGYALTWFGLAAGLLVVSGFWAAGRRT